jgi:hypothetical protein
MNAFALLLVVATLAGEGAKNCVPPGRLSSRA